MLGRKKVKVTEGVAVVVGVNVEVAVTVVVPVVVGAVLLIVPVRAVTDPVMVMLGVGVASFAPGAKERKIKPVQ